MHLKTLSNAIAMAACVLLVHACNGRDHACAEGPGKTVRTIDAPPDTAQLSDYIVAAFEDSKGNRWFGTVGDGVVRYSPAPSFVPGERLTYFTTKDGLADMVSCSIVEDRKGNIWIGSHDGATRFDGSTFTAFKKNEGLHGPGCVLLVDRAGTLWAGTNDGAFRFDGKRFQPFLIPAPAIEDPSHKWVAGKVWSLLEDSKGNIWFGRDGLGATKYTPPSRPGGSDGHFTHYTKKDGLCSNNVARIVEDTEGNLWFGSITSDFPPTKEGGVARFDGLNFTHFTNVKGLTGADVYTIFTERSGHVWVCPVGVGAYRYDGTGFTLFDHTDRPHLTQNFGVQAVLEDGHGTLWFGFSGGLFRFNGTSFTNVTRGELLAP